MRTHLRIWLALAALTLPAQAGCSLMGLDRLDQGSCTNDAQCSSLEAIQPTGNACRTWQCNNAVGGSGVCAIDTRDDDGDGAAPMMCVVAPALPDCDDADGMRSPLSLDRCNLLDDNCDGVIDEGFAGGLSNVVETSASTSRISFSRNATSTDVSVVELRAGMPIRKGAVAAGGTVLTLQPIIGASRPDRNVGTHATLGGEGSIVVFDPVSADTTCLPSVSVCGDGICNPLTEVPTIVSACASDCPCAGPTCVAPNVCGNGTCDTGENVANCYSDCPPIVGHWLRTNETIAGSLCMEPTGLASATLTPEPNGDALLVWVDDSAARVCGTARAATVRARLLRTTSPAGLNGSNIMDLGTTADWLGPSAVFVEGVGFIVAHTTQTGDIELHRIPVPDTAGFNALAATSIGLSGATGAAEVSLANAGGTDLAVSFVQGACTASRVVFQRASVTAATATWQAAINLQAAADVERHAPVASRNGTVGSMDANRRGEWAVFYRQGDDAFAQRLSADTTAPTGNPVQIMGAGRSEGRPYVEAKGASWGYLTTTRSAAPSTADIVSGSLACVDPS